MTTTADPMDVALGAAVRDLRKRIKLSQSELGAALGISFQQIQKYERGTNRISFSALVKIAGALGMTASQLIASVDGSAAGERPADVAELERLFSRILTAPMRQAVIDLARAAAEGMPS